jgi:hypothetical protein
LLPARDRERWKTLLEHLDAIRWAELGHAYGPAGDVPDAIRALASPHAAERRRAREWLWSSLCHQTTIYVATLYAVPFLLELLASPDVQSKDDLLLFLDAVGAGSIHVPLERKTRAAVRAGCPLYERFLADPSTRVRAAALELLVSVCGDEAEEAERVIALLRRQLDRERSPVLRIRVIDGLVRLRAMDVETMQQIAQIFRSTHDDALRLAAAVALGLMQTAQADELVEALLLGTLISPESRVIQRYEQGIGSRNRGASHSSQVGHVLRHLGEQRVARIQDTLLRALAAECHMPDASSFPLIGRQSVPYHMPDATMYWRDIEGRFEYPLPPALKLAQALLFLGFGPHPGSARLPPHLREIPLSLTLFDQERGRQV